jgi:hypothetical protein
VRKEDAAITAALGPNFRAVTENARHYSVTEQMTLPLAGGAGRCVHAPHCAGVHGPTASRSRCIHLMFPEYLKNRLA